MPRGEHRSMQRWAGPLGGTWSILTVLSDSSIKKEGDLWPWRQCRQGYWCLTIPSTSLFLFWFQQILEQVKKARSGQWITPWLAASWPWWCLPCCVCSSSWGAILPDIKVSQALGQPGGLVSPRRLPLGDLEVVLDRQFGFCGHTASLIPETGREKNRNLSSGWLGLWEVMSSTPWFGFFSKWTAL